MDGAPYCPRSVDDAWDHGVALVLQEPALIPSLTVGENVYLGQEHAFTRLGVLWPPTRDRQARAALEDVGLATSPRAIVSDLSYEERKLVEVARAVSLHPKVLVIDETTASLSHQGTQLLYRQIRRLRDAGTAIIYISHYLEEVFELCDRVSVLKDGQLVGTWDIGEMSIERLSHAMVGRDLDLHAVRSDQRELHSDRCSTTDSRRLESEQGGQFHGHHLRRLSRGNRRYRRDRRVWIVGGGALPIWCTDC